LCAWTEGESSWLKVRDGSASTAWEWQAFFRPGTGVGNRRRRHDVDLITQRNRGSRDARRQDP
jgi:hypothetical protein